MEITAAVFFFLAEKKAGRKKERFWTVFVTCRDGGCQFLDGRYNQMPAMKLVKSETYMTYIYLKMHDTGSHTNSTQVQP